MCGYCYRDKQDIELCQLTHHYNTSKEGKSGNRVWQYPKWICKECRIYLRGYLRLCPDDVAEQYGF